VDNSGEFDLEPEIVRAPGRRVIGQSRPGALLRGFGNLYFVQFCPDTLCTFHPTASLKCPRWLALVRMLGTHLTKHRLLPVLSEKMGGWSAGGNHLTQPPYDVTSVLEQRWQSIKILELQGPVIGPVYGAILWFIQIQYSASTESTMKWALAESTDREKIM
jgi:hypothetical protein